MHILVACEESQAVTTELRKLGHTAFSNDLLPCSGGHPEWHLLTDTRKCLSLQWDMIIAFPPLHSLSSVGGGVVRAEEEGRAPTGSYRLLHGYSKRGLSADCHRKPCGYHVHSVEEARSDNTAVSVRRPVFKENLLVAEGPAQANPHKGGRAGGESNLRKWKEYG